MAKLTETQLKRRVEREKQKQDAVRKKMEIQKKKEIYGENWRQVEQQKLRDELEAEIGGENTPKIYDSKDLYDFFIPISFYKDEENKKLKMDFKKFSESEELYREALEEIDNDLDKIKESDLKEDGVLPEDSDLPSENIEDDSNIKNEEELKEQEESSSKNSKSTKKKQPALSEQAKAKGKILQTVSIYFNRFVPLYDKHICTCCGMPKSINDYYTVYNLTCSNRVDVNGSFHMWVCKECANKLFAYCYCCLAQQRDLKLQLL